MGLLNALIIYFPEETLVDSVALVILYPFR